MGIQRKKRKVLRERGLAEEQDLRTGIMATKFWSRKGSKKHSKIVHTYIFFIVNPFYLLLMGTDGHSLIVWGLRPESAWWSPPVNKYFLWLLQSNSYIGYLLSWSTSDTHNYVEALGQPCDIRKKEAAYRQFQLHCDMIIIITCCISTLMFRNHRTAFSLINRHGGCTVKYISPRWINIFSTCIRI